MISSTVNQMAFCPPPSTYKKDHVNMWLDTDRGSKIPAFHIRRGHPLTMLVSHANAEDLGVVLAFWSSLSEMLKVDVFAYEYSGYGCSTGSPSEQNMYSDARAALDLLRDGFKLKPERDIVLYGKSIGSCPTCYLAGRNLVRGVILVSGLASGARVLFPTTKLWVADALYFNNLGHLSSNKSPVQLIHGTADETVPFSSGEDLHGVCKVHHPLPPTWVKGASHNNVETVHMREYIDSLQTFLAHLLATPPANIKQQSSWLNEMMGSMRALWCGPGQASRSNREQ